MPLKLIKRKGQKNWYIRGTVRGAALFESTGTDQKGQAEAIRIQREGELLNRSVFGVAATTTFLESAVGYLKAGGEGKYLENILARIGHRLAGDIRQADLDDTAQALYPNAKPSTINRQAYTPMIAVLNYFDDSNNTPRRRWRRPKAEQTRIDWRTPQEVEKLIDVAGDDAPLITFLAGTGARISEALSMPHRDVGFDRTTCTLWETKGNYPRTIQLQKRVQVTLPSLGAGELVFGGQRQDFAKRLLKICEAAGVPKTTPHTLRHTWATWAYAVTRDIPFLKDQGGWRSDSMALRYAHLAPQGLSQAVLAHGWEIRALSVHDFTEAEDFDAISMG